MAGEKFVQRFLGVKGRARLGALGVEQIAEKRGDDDGRQQAHHQRAAVGEVEHQVFAHQRAEGAPGGRAGGGVGGLVGALVGALVGEGTVDCRGWGVVAMVINPATGGR